MAESPQGVSPGGAIGELERVVKENEARQLKILLINARHEGVMAPLKEGNAAAKRGGNTTA